MPRITRKELEQYCKATFGDCAAPEQAAIAHVFRVGNLTADGSMERRAVVSALRRIGTDILYLGNKLEAQG